MESPEVYLKCVNLVTYPSIGDEYQILATENSKLKTVYLAIRRK